MAAPALILLSEGSTERHVVENLHQLRKQMQMQRTELSVQLAFLDHYPPTGPQVISSLANRGVQEVVFVPLSLTRAVDPGTAAVTMLNNVRRAHPAMSAVLGRPVGPATELLNIVDIRLRNALSQAHATELDGLVLCVPENGDVRGTALVQRRARQWASHHKLPVTVASCDGNGACVSLAIRNLREQGRRAVAVGSLFLTGDARFAQMADEALHTGAIAVSSPLGNDARVLDLVMSRYSYAAMGLVDEVEGGLEWENDSAIDQAASL